MSLVAAKCPQCGANLEVDPSKDAGVCKYCNTPFITEKAIVNYNTTIVHNNNIYANNVNVLAGDFNNLIKNVRDCFDSGDMNGAYDRAVKALELEPDDVEAQLYKAISSGYNEFSLESAYQCFNKYICSPSYIIDEKNQEFACRFIGYYENLIDNIFADVRKSYVKYINEDDNLSTTFNSYDVIYKNFVLLEKLYKKLYSSNKSYKTVYLNVIKSICFDLSLMCEKHDYVWIVDANGLHYKKKDAPNVLIYLALKGALEKNIQEMDPNYKPVKIKKNVNKNVIIWWTIAGLFVLGCIIGVAVLI